MHHSSLFPPWVSLEQTEAASWTEAESSTSLGTAPRAATTGCAEPSPAHHQGKVELLGHGWAQPECFSERLQDLKLATQGALLLSPS